MASRLTVARVRSIAQPGMYGDGGTLYLKVAPGGSKSWIQRVTIDGRRHDIGLGGFPLVTLARARELAFDNRRVARSGGDPLAAKRRARIPTFREAAQKTFAANKRRWRNGKHTRNWIQSLAKYAFPVLGDMGVHRIGREELLRVLEPIWVTKPATARKLRQRIRATLSWCQAHGYIEHNWAGEAINGALPAMPSVRAHFRAIPYRDVPDALTVVDAGDGSPVVKQCFRFLVLTASRSGEARNAMWDEIDLHGREWRIPATRMKAGAEHRVPLSDQSKEVLVCAARLRDDSGLVFPSPTRRGRPLSDMTLMKTLRATGLAERTTVHGFRSAFRDWASECTDMDHAAIELSLAHKVGSAVERAYARSDLMEKRRLLMGEWGYFASGSIKRRRHSR